MARVRLSIHRLNAGRKKMLKKSDQLNQLKEYIERGFQNIPKRFHVLSISKGYFSTS